MNSRPYLFCCVALLCSLAFSSLVKSELVEGRIEVLVSDNFVDGSSHNHVFLHEYASGKRIPLEVSSIGPKVHELRTGMFGKALIDFSDQGTLKRDNSLDNLDQTSIIEDGEMPIKVISLEWTEDLEMMGVSSAKRTESPGSWTLANLRRLLVVIVDFEDEQVKCDAWNISQTIWGNKGTAYQGDVGPWKNTFRVFNLNSGNRFFYARNSTSLGSGVTTRDFSTSSYMDTGYLEYEKSAGEQFGSSKRVSTASSSTAPVLETRDVVGPYRLRRSLKSEPTCAYNTWADEALKLAVDLDNIPVGQYNQVSFVLPNSDRLHSSLCRWTGLAHVGCGFLCRSWISDCASLGVFSHEFGHNAGFGHAGSYWGHSSPFVEYGDPTGIMSNQWGYGQYRNVDFYFNVIHRNQLGWITTDHIVPLNSAHAPDDATIGYYTSLSEYVASIPHSNTENSDFIAWTNRGTFFASSTARIFRIAPFHVPSLANVSQALQIQKSGSDNRYWISYQTGNVAFPNRALVHVQATPSTSQTFIVQTIMPKYMSGQNVSMHTETILYRDPDLNFAARILRASGDFMDVLFTWNCERRNPEIRLSSSTTSVHLLSHDIGEESDRALFALPSSVKQFTFSMPVISLHSDMCNPSSFEIVPHATDKATIVCDRPEVTVQSGFSCPVHCTVNLVGPLTSQPPLTIEIIERNIISREILTSRHITIEMIDTNCRQNVPHLELISSPQLTSIDRQSVSGKLKITNLDLKSCKPRAFELSSETSANWTSSIPGLTSLIAPGSSLEFVVQTYPDSSVPPGSGASVAVKAANIDSTIITFHIILKNSCVRVPPLIEMENVAVSFYSRNAAAGPIRVTNMDPEHSDCSSSLFSASLLPDEYRLLQSAIYPSSIDLMPGESFTFILTVSVPNDAQPPFGVSQLAQTIMLDSSHHPRQSFSQYTYNLVSPCVARTPSLGLSCPEFYTITKSSKVVDFTCNFGWRNNDNFLCPPTTFNVTFNYTYLPLGPHLDASPYLIGAKAKFTEERLIAGMTQFYSITVSCNFTDVYDLLNSKSAMTPTMVMALKAEMMDTEGVLDHFGSTATGALLFGICVPQLNPTVVISNSTGPYDSIDLESLPASSHTFNRTPDSSIIPSEPHTPLKAPNAVIESNPDSLFFPTQPETSLSPTEPDPSQSPFPTTESPESNMAPVIDGFVRYPLINMHHGLTREINWTISNPSNLFCSKILYDLVLAHDSNVALTAISAGFVLRPTNIDGGSSGDVSLVLTLPTTPLPTNVSGLVNITVQTRFTYNSTKYLSDPMTIFLNATSRCIIRPPQLVPASNIGISSPSSQGSLYPIQFQAHSGLRQRFYTILNLTNLDTPPCAEESIGSAPTYSFNITARSVWKGLSNVIGVSITNISSSFGAELNYSSSVFDGSVDIFPQTWKLFNVSFDVPPSMIPGTYKVEVAVTNGDLAQHRIIRVVQFEVKSNPPLPVWDFTGVELKSGLGVSLGFNLQWRACELAGDCACPCTYLLFLNGAFHASLNSTSYAHRYSMAQAGVESTVQVIVQDSLGRNSSVNACGSKFTFTPTDSPYAHLFIFIVLCAVTAFPALVLLMEYLRNRELLPLSNIQFRFDPDTGEEFDEEMQPSDAVVNFSEDKRG